MDVLFTLQALVLNSVFGFFIRFFFYVAVSTIIQMITENIQYVAFMSLGGAMAAEQCADAESEPKGDGIVDVNGFSETDSIQAFGTARATR